MFTDIYKLFKMRELKIQIKDKEVLLKLSYLESAEPMILLIFSQVNLLLSRVYDRIGFDKRKYKK